VAEKLNAIYQNKPDYAVIYPIIIQDKLEVILGVPGTPLVHFSTQSSDDIKDLLANFRSKLIRSMNLKEFQNKSFQLYKMMITPVDRQIDNKSILFILDIPLQSLPMSALYNKITEKYLIQTHTIRMTSSLQMLQIDAEKHPITEVLTAGIAKPRTERNIPFSSLEYVEQELDDIRKHFPGSQKLFEEKFTQSNLEQALSHQTFPAIHLATHGHFSSQRYLTFLLDGQTIIEVADFKRLFAEPSYLTTNPIQLLVLSACQTAQGDRKSALGIAGLTVSGQINNTIASLWSVNDESTAKLMNKFYEKLMEFSSPDIPQSDRTALALQEAQKSMIEEDEFKGEEMHYPNSWSPFILLSNAL
ncbi:MAG: CHAT domain-containing protein, partial [Planktothrix sp.]